MASFEKVGPDFFSFGDQPDFFRFMGLGAIFSGRLSFFEFPPRGINGVNILGGPDLAPFLGGIWGRGFQFGPRGPILGHWFSPF